MICCYNNNILNNTNYSSYEPGEKNSINHIPFDQSTDIISKLNYQDHKTLLEINGKFGGLCELICNRLLIDDSLGKENDLNSLKDRITVERMNPTEIKKSHLLNVYSVFRRVIAYLFGIYPDNIFSCFDQWKLVQKASVNRKILEKGLSNIKEGKTLKLEVFSKKFLSFTGHSLLIKKISKDSYIFFDPNMGEYRGLSLCELSNRIDKQLKMLNGTDIFITKGNRYLKRLKNN